MPGQREGCVADQPTLTDYIQALMIEGNLEPTPSHYEFLYRYAVGADPQLTEAVDAVRRTPGAFGARAVSQLRRELFGTGSSGVGRLIEDTERQLSRMSEYVGRSDADARVYRERLGSVELGTTLERQRGMLADMVEATNVMIQRTEALQAELLRSAHEVEMLKADLEVARIESRSDPLTGLSNRKACCDYLDVHIARALQARGKLALIFLDIDHFKKFNDSFGHRMGDEVLRLVAQSLERFFHGAGFVARWGGEEFVVVMPDLTANEAAAHADRFREHIAGRTVRTRNSGREIGRVTLSLGVADLIADDDAQAIIDRADRALYDAKAEGRDRVVCWREAA